MSPRDATRRIIDKEGNEYFVSIPQDVNLQQAEDILLSMHQGIVKLCGYRLASEGVYRLPDTIETDGKAFTFYKKLHMFTEFPGMSQEDFSDAINDLLTTAREQRINRAEITTIEGRSIKTDHRGKYIDWSVKCDACGVEIKGRRPVSYSNGYPTRAQMFEPDDARVTRPKPGSKIRLCPTCSIRSVSVEEHMKPVVPRVYQGTTEKVTETPVKPSEPVLVKGQVVVTDATRKDLEELLVMSKHDSGVGLEYFKGMVYGVIKSMLK